MHSEQFIIKTLLRFGNLLFFFFLQKTETDIQVKKLKCPQEIKMDSEGKTLELSKEIFLDFFGLVANALIHTYIFMPTRHS